MRAVDRFEQRSKTVYNGQDVLKNHFLHGYPKHYTDDTMDYSIVEQYKDHDYVWIIDKRIETLRTFPWHFKPTTLGEYKFPYVYKRSKRILSWEKVKLVPTKPYTDVFEEKHICAKYDVLAGKTSFDVFYGITYAEAQEKTTTDMFWLVPDDVEVSDFFKFTYMPDDWSQKYVHVFRNGDKENKDGIILAPKNYTPTDNELLHRFYAEKKEISILASRPKPFPAYSFSTYEEYTNAIDNLEVDMCWWIPDDVDINSEFEFMYIPHSNQYDRHINHVFLNGDSYDGVMLLSKYCRISEREFRHRFLGVKKEHEVVASLPKKFDTFVVNNYSDYKRAMKNSRTEMFWSVPDDVKLTNDLNLYFSHHDMYNRNITHVFKNNNTYDGVALCSKNIEITRKEIEHRFYSEKKEHNIIYSTPKTFDYFEIETYEDYLEAKENSTTDMFWMSSPQLRIYQKCLDEFYISHHNIIDRNQTHAFLHSCDDKICFNGVFLIPKKITLTENEILHRHPVNRKEHNTVFSIPAPYEYFQIDSYDEYLYALENSKTEMFWMSSRNINTSQFDFDFVFNHTDTYDRNINHAYLHKIDDNEYLFNGLFLCSKTCTLTQKEVEHRHLAKVKQHSTLGSTVIVYNKFVIDTYDDYLYALENSKTEMFWGVGSNLKDYDDFDFDLYFSHNNSYDRTSNHAFLNQGYENVDYNGYFLFSKHKTVTQKEIEHRHIVNAKEWDIVASSYGDYDICFVDTYDEYLKAMDESITELFWAVSRNINIDNYDFDLAFDHHNTYDRFQNHTFIHNAKGQQTRNGVFLLSKHKPITQKEIEHRHLVDAKHWDIEASQECIYNMFLVETYNDYLDAMENSDTEMFWGYSNNIDFSEFDESEYYFSHDNFYDRNINHTFVHLVGDFEYRNGMFLFSKHAPVTQKEIEHRHLVKAKHWDDVASFPVNYQKFVINNYNDYLAAMQNSKTEMFWAIPSDVEVDINFEFDLYFTHDNTYDRNITHIFKNGEHWDGVALFSTHSPVTEQEINHRWYAHRKEHDVIISQPKPFPVYNIETYDDYLNAYDTSPSEMFWATTPNIKINEDFDLSLYFSRHNSYDRTINHTFIHRVDDNDYHNGLFLCTKHAPLTEKEIEHRLIARRKEHDVVASGPVQYEKFVINTYKDYENAIKKSKTEMFWMIPPEVNVSDDFKFDLYFTHNQWFERETNHVFLNGDARDGISLISKTSPVTQREIDMRFLTNKKEYNVVASTPTLYDIVFISKDEEHADNNYKLLTDRFPRAKRVHGVEGIHAAHIEAAKLCKTDMIWIVDADAEIVENFNFDYYVPAYDPDSRKTVHVWKSQNPVNGLIYGYGAVKLLPRELTLNMDTSKPDMTTSISPLFKTINRISNITKFNTDEFSTWRSAFRECVKLASRAIDGQLDEETEFRLNAWCTRGKDKQFGNAAINGANHGKKYGESNRGKLEALVKINDFNWLRNEFDKFKNSL